MIGGAGDHARGEAAHEAPHPTRGDGLAPILRFFVTVSQQTIASPEELERFVRELKQSNGQLRKSISHSNGQFRRLGDTWGKPSVPV